MGAHMQKLPEDGRKVRHTVVAKVELGTKRAAKETAFINLRFDNVELAKMLHLVEVMTVQNRQPRVFVDTEKNPSDIYVFFSVLPATEDLLRTFESDTPKSLPGNLSKIRLEAVFCGNVSYDDFKQFWGSYQTHKCFELVFWHEESASPIYNIELAHIKTGKPPAA